MNIWAAGNHESFARQTKLAVWAIVFATRGKGTTYYEGYDSADFRLPAEAALQKVADADNILDVSLHPVDVVLHRLR